MLTIIGTITAALVAVQQQPARRIPLDSGWTLSGEGTRIETVRGVRAIRLRTGRAIRRDVQLEDGTIEFDLLVTRYRSFAYVQYRMATDEDHEENYIRPHKTDLPDAIQYAPVWHGESNWQLYHGPGGTAAVHIPHDAWTHVRLVLQGRRGALFIGPDTAPALLMDLARDPAAGYLAFNSFVPAGGAPNGISTMAVANVVVRPGVVGYRFPAERAPAPVAGLITRWQLSPPFAVQPGPITTLPAEALATRTSWPSFPVEPTGVVVIGRHVARPAAQAGIIARLVLHADADGLQGLHLGFSDYATVFVNGRPLFSADAHYSFDRPRQDGVIGLWQSAVWLPLTRGENEVLIAVSDGFGGWGLIGQLEPGDGSRLVTTP